MARPRSRSVIVFRHIVLHGIEQAADRLQPARILAGLVDLAVQRLRLDLRDPPLEGLLSQRLAFGRRHRREFLALPAKRRRVHAGLAGQRSLAFAGLRPDQAGIPVHQVAARLRVFFEHAER